MPTYRITGPDGKEFDVTAPDGASEDEVLSYAQRNFKMAAAPKKSKPFGQQLNEFVADVPRQVGLTARYGLEGVGGIADLVTSPIRAGLNAVGANIKPGIGEAAADIVGLPKPQTAGERVIGDAARLVAGGAVPLGAGAALARGTGAAANVGRVLASNPGQQLASAAGSGLAGGYTRETGGNDTAQMIASLAGGVAAPMALSAGARAVTSFSGKVKRLDNAIGAIARAASREPAIQPQQQIEITINNALRDSGITLADLPAEAARSLRQDVEQAYKLGDNLNPDAVRRLADYRITGLTPTSARLTQDPSDITRQANTAKLGANSRDPQAQALARTQNGNNKQLIAQINGLGANAVDDIYAGGSKIIQALKARDEKAQELIGGYYRQARATDGRSAALDPAAFSGRANNALDQALLGGAIPADIRELMNGVAKGKIPFTVDIAEQFKTRLGDAARDAAARGEKSTAKAVSMVRSALDDTPLLDGEEIGQQAIDAFKLGRRMNATYMDAVGKTPALQAVRDGIEPDKFVQQFIIGNGAKSNVMDVAQLKNSIKNRPDAMQAVKGQILASIKSKALSGAADEVANFSQSAYNKALRDIGDRKLRLFFSPEEVSKLKAIGRVSSYEQVQPVGSAVNNSNTAGAVFGILDKIGGSSLLNKIPLGRALVGDPLESIVLSSQAGRALNAPRSLVTQPLQRQASPVVLSPAMLMGTDTEESKRQRSLLDP